MEAVWVWQVTPSEPRWLFGWRKPAPRVQAVAAIAPPAKTLTEAASTEVLAPKLVVGAEQDHDLPVQQFRFLASRLSEPTEVEVIRDADHFFTDHAPDLSKMVVEFFARRLGRQAAGSP